MGCMLQHTIVSRVRCSQLKNHYLHAIGLQIEQKLRGFHLSISEQTFG